MLATTTENWTPNARGTRLSFQTVTNGTNFTGTRMTINHDGRVGIGIPGPQQMLDVAGNVRVGSFGGMTGCVEDRDGTLIAGNCGSDARFKRDIASFEPMLGKVASLRPVHYFWRGDEFPARGYGQRQSYGLVAQEVQDVLPELVTTDAEGYKAVNYSKLPLMAVQAIKELKAENDDCRRGTARVGDGSAVEGALRDLIRLRPHRGRVNHHRRRLVPRLPLDREPCCRSRERERSQARAPGVASKTSRRRFAALAPSSLLPRE